MRRTVPAIALLLLLASVGCHSSGVVVRPVREDSIFDRLRENALNSGTCSFRTEQLLRRYDLNKEFRKDPQRVLKALDAQVRRQPTPDSVFALAELCFLSGEQAERHDRQAALSFYAGTVAYSYFYLFDDNVAAFHSEYDPRFRLACDLYNRSLKKCIRLAQKQQIRLEDSLHVDFADGAIDIQILRHGLLWDPEDVDHYEFADDYEVLGLDNHYHTFGLGVPLIAVRKEAEQIEPQERFYPKEHSFPVTAFLRMNCGVSEFGRLNRVATLELYDPSRIQEIAVHDKSVPLESDLTTPLGFYLSRSRLERFELSGLLRPESVQDKAGLYMLQPYEPGKIPVVFVHGLWSSPIIWMPAINDLQGDQTLRNHYQFWYFMYPTGNPFAYSAAMLRTSLNEALRSLDPEEKDPALRQMVLVGHSMGGLLSKMMIQDSQSELWDLVSKEPIDKIQADDEELERIRQIFLFEPQPFVDRVIFIATPHRGSNVSKRPVGRIGSALISLPRALLETQARLLDKNPEAFTPFFREQLPTSVDNLSPDSPVIQAVARLQMNPKVHYHSIIGNTREGELIASNDGVVPYTSSHLEGAESEYIVPSGHSTCQYHPLTVLEIQRILYDHLDSVQTDVKIHHADLQVTKD